jgi:hypothetical protein
MKDFMVLLVADAALRFPLGDSLTVRLMKDEKTPVTIKIGTRYLSVDGQDPIPGALELLVNAKAQSIEEALQLYNKIANFCANGMSVVANALVRPLELSRAWECTPGSADRPFLCAAVSDYGIPRLSRTVPPSAAKLFFDGLLSPDDPRDTARLFRAISQYRLALDFWNVELPLSHAHLFIGMEALVPVAVRQRLRERGLTDKENLFDDYGIDPTLPPGRKNGLLDAAIRLEVLFQSDRDVHKNAKEASDGYEHGYLELDRIEQLAQASRDRTAEYLRSAIINFVVPPEQRQLLREGPFKTPFVPVMLVGLEGRITSAAEDDVEHELDSVTPRPAVVKNRYDRLTDTYSREFTLSSGQFPKYILVEGVRLVHLT